MLASLTREPRWARCLWAHTLFTASAVLQLAMAGCSRDEVAHAAAASISGLDQALASSDLHSLNGTYGAGCVNRAGPWSVAVASGALLDHAELSVLLNNVTCDLSLTEARTLSGLSVATPAMLLTTSYQGSPSLFSGAVEFAANAKLSTVLFAEDFLLTLLHVDDPRLAARDHTATAIPPTVTAHYPPAGAVNLSIATRVTATFSAPMEPSSINALTFTLSQGGVPIAASVTYDVATYVATLIPTAALALDQLHEARVTTGAYDVGSTPLAVDFSWTFTTAVCSQAPVPLGLAAPFAVLAASTVTNTGPTVITGDLGVSPGTAVTGFPPGIVVGAMHAADAVAAAAVVDLTTAYTVAEARAVCPVTKTGDVGGQTLTPGLYRSGSTLAISTGDLTLDALGEADAVFVFQMDSTLNVGAGRQVLLANGAQATNVFWQVGSAATLETGSQCVGTILANFAVTLATGANLDGRALSQAAAVTLDANLVQRPLP